MGLTVRYPNGTTITYHQANLLEYGDKDWSIYTKKGGRWIASIQPSSGAIVEAVRPSAVNRSSDLRGALETVITECRTANCAERGLLAELKALLRDFDARDRTWR